MCGPFSLFFIGKESIGRPFMIYHLGRILTYILIGIVLGLASEAINMLELQRFTAFALGGALVLLYGIPGALKRIERIFYQSRIFSRIRTRFFNKKKGNLKWVASGMLNGLLPCGLTFVAAAGALAYGDFANSVLFMASFGVATLPALLLVVYGNGLLKNKVKALIPQSFPIIALLTGSILILRASLITYPNFHQLVQNNAAALITVCGL